VGARVEGPAELAKFDQECGYAVARAFGKYRKLTATVGVVEGRG